MFSNYFHGSSLKAPPFMLISDVRYFFLQLTSTSPKKGDQSYEYPQKKTEFKASYCSVYYAKANFIGITKCSLH